MQSASPQARTVSLEQAARELGIGRTTAYLAAQRGEIPVLRIGRRVLVPRRALDRLLGEVSPEQEPRDSAPDAAEAA